MYVGKTSKCFRKSLRRLKLAMFCAFPTYIKHTYVFMVQNQIFRTNEKIWYAKDVLN